MKKITPKDLTAKYEVEFDNSGEYNWERQEYEYKNGLNSASMTRTGWLRPDFDN